MILKTLLPLIGIFILFSGCTNGNLNSRNVSIKEIKDSLVREVGKFDDNKNRTGKWIGYYSDSIIAYEGYYSKGLKDSNWTFFNSEGVREKEEKYRNGQRHGIFYVYSEGVLYDKINFISDQKNGRHVHYFSNNRINFYQDYKNNLFDGEFVLFYENGKIKQKGLFSKGLSFGEWLLYDSTGNEIEKIIYDSLSTKYREIKLNVNGDTIYDLIKNR